MPPTHFDPTAITWAALLGRWTDFARSAIAFPDDDPLRHSVADIITLQAVWFALHHLDELPADERALGLDRAQVLIDKHAAALADIWRDKTMPDQLTELIRDVSNKLGLGTIRDPSPRKGNEP